MITVNKSRQSYHQNIRNIRFIVKAFELMKVPVREEHIDIEDFLVWMHAYQDLTRRYAKSGDVFIEKCLEHYVSTRLLNLKPGHVYIDVAGSNSNFAPVLCDRGIDAYQLDLDYPDGVHGRKIGADAGNTGLPTESVNGMSLQCAFECFQGDADIRFIREAQRILCRGGRTIINPLYVDHEHFIITHPDCNQDEIPFDEGALKVWREDRYVAPFSRHYSPKAFRDRIVSQILPGNDFYVIHFNNLDELKLRFPEQRIYCDLAFVLEKRVSYPAA
ncbi:MAG: hypothetical protein JXR25_04905 [Pontiellaceae bacterium]|nr:hypothetical protein [Pontiellaceae bacterium]MBN2784146.1 hypothetical protein [Pontiellaceae bacterium]